MSRRANDAGRACPQQEKAPWLDGLLAQVRALLAEKDLSSAAGELRQAIDSLVPFSKEAARTEAALREIESRISSSTQPRQLSHLNEELIELAEGWFSISESAAAVHQICSFGRRAIAARALEMTLGLQAGMPVPNLALLSTGSDGRQEQTLYTDQDFLLVQADTTTLPPPYSGSGGLLELGRRLTDNLEQAGIRRCSGGIMTCNPDWIGTETQWHARVTSMVRFDTEDMAKNCLNLAILADLHCTAGDHVLGQRVADQIALLLQGNFHATATLMRAACELKVGIGFLGRFDTEKKGPDKGTLNLKLKAWLPLVMCMKALACSYGLPQTNTVERLIALTEQHAFDLAFAGRLALACRSIAQLRIAGQIATRHNGSQGGSGDIIDPSLLDEVKRDQLRSALSTIVELQKVLGFNCQVK